MYFKNDIDVRITDILTDWLISKSRRYEMSFFGHLALLTNISERKDIPTMGVWISASGFNLGYNAAFLNKLNTKNTEFVLIHEFMHLISNHIDRTRQFNLNRKLSNIAQDCVINSEIIEHYSKHVEMIEGGFKMPSKFDDLWISEVVYEYLQSDKFKNEDPQMSEQIEKLMDEEDSVRTMDTSGLSPEELNDLIDKIMKSGQFDIHMENEVPDEIAEQIANENLSSLKTRGLTSSNIEKYIDRITPRKTDYASKIKKSVSTLSGANKFETYTRMNRRGIAGKKGFKRDGVGFNVLLDVSGSMNGFIEFVLGYCFQNNILLNILQVDAQVQKVEQFTSKKDLSKIQIKGYGGTELQPGVDYVAGNKELRKLNTMILTDGYCDNLDFSNLPGKKLIISVGIEVKYTGSGVTQIVVDPEEIKRDSKRK